MGPGATWHEVRWARYAARKHGFTAVPVRQGKAAVVTMTTCTGAQHLGKVSPV